jgi:hypothetical protein
MLRDAEPEYEMRIKPYKSEPKQVDEVLSQSEPTPVDNLELGIRPADFLEKLEKRPFEAEPKKTDAEPVYYD